MYSLLKTPYSLEKSTVRDLRQFDAILYSEHDVKWTYTNSYQVMVYIYNKLVWNGLSRKFTCLASVWEYHMKYSVCIAACLDSEMQDESSSPIPFHLSALCCCE